MLCGIVVWTMMYARTDKQIHENGSMLEQINKYTIKQINNLQQSISHRDPKENGSMLEQINKYTIKQINNLYQINNLSHTEIPKKTQVC